MKRLAKQRYEAQKLDGCSFAPKINSEKSRRILHDDYVPLPERTGEKELRGLISLSLKPFRRNSTGKIGESAASTSRG